MATTTSRSVGKHIALVLGSFPANLCPISSRYRRRTLQFLQYTRSVEPFTRSSKRPLIIGLTLVGYRTIVALRILHEFSLIVRRFRQNGDRRRGNEG